MTSRATPIRVGIVGIGNWARYGHLPALELLPEFQLQAIYSQRPEASRAAVKENDIPHVVGSLDELVRHPEVDLVAVLTTAPQHAGAARAAIAAGKDSPGPPPENFSSMVAIYAGHFLDMVFTALGWPESISALAVNQFPGVTILETGEVIPTTNADELVLSGTYANGAVLSAHFEGGKRNGSGVQLDAISASATSHSRVTFSFEDRGSK